MKAGTGLAQGRLADPALAEQAVHAAMTRAELEHPEALLLYLSADFAHDPQPAISAAARSCGCMQVVGCTAAGVFTEEDWILDAPAAAALVLGDGAGLRMAKRYDEPALDAQYSLWPPPMLWICNGSMLEGNVSAVSPAMPQARGHIRSGVAAGSSPADAANWN